MAEYIASKALHKLTMQIQKIIQLIALQKQLIINNSKISSNNCLHSPQIDTTEEKIAKLTNILELQTYLFNLAKQIFKNNNPLVRETQLSQIKTINHQLLFDYLTILIKHFFLTIRCFISKPRFELTNKSLLIKLVYFNYNRSALVLNNSILRQIKIFIFVLSRLLNRNIIFELTAINKPNLDCTILAKTISIITDKFGYSFRYITNNIINNSNIVNLFDSVNALFLNQLTGINFRLAGRLTRQPIIPRFTVKTIQTGSLSRNATNSVTSAKVFANNRKGTFCYTITFGHRFY